MHRPSSVRPFLLFILILAGAWSAPAKAQWIDGGGFHTCALDAAGKAYCWGDNLYGTLGRGTTTGWSTSAAPVSGIPEGLTTISSGDQHACALTAAQGVKCWGYNAYGQLGDGTNQDSAVPVDVQGLTSGVSAISAGGSHTCAILLTGAMKCWGYNGNGQLGDGTTTDRNAPVDVLGLPAVVAGISAGYLHTCALTPAGSVKCWGENFLGALGDGTRTDRHTPVDVVGLASGVASVAAGGGHTCAMGAQGLWLKCWGRNEFGQVGDNSYAFAFHTEPVDVANVPGTIAMIAAGLFHTCLLTTGGDVSCWGANEYGQLANGGTGWGSPFPVPSLTGGVTRIGAGSYHSCAISTDGLARCWGRNDSGQLGDGTSGTNRTTPVVVTGFLAGGGTLPGPGAAQSIGAGNTFACALTPAGGVSCWGDNTLGTLGDGTQVSRTVAGPVSGLSSGVVALAAGAGHACALLDTGGVKCWGDNTSGAVGDGTHTIRLAPVDVAGLSSGIGAIAAGNIHTCALTQAGGVLCWGAGGDGQLGDGTWNDRLEPTPVPGLETGVTAIAAAKGGVHTCALLGTGAVRCWGGNDWGQLGDGTLTPRPSPVDVLGLPAQVDAITAGSGHNCVRTSSGELHCWGRNDWGQLGDGTGTNRSAPVAVAGLSGSAVQAAAGGYHTCALMADGTVQCWGFNELGELGESTLTLQRGTPADVPGLPGPAAAVVAGFRYNCARLADGTIQCWGANGGGQLGRGNVSLYEDTPAGVVTYMGGDIVPDVFAFTPATGVAPGAVVTSGPVTITGITMPAIVSVTGGEYSVGCTATYTADFGVVLAGQSVCVRHTASAAPNATTTTTLTVSTVSASFTSTTSSGVVLQEYPLTVTKSGTGSGTVTSNPVGINCGATCQFPFGDATVVSLTATADAGSVFAGWSGACTGTGACSFTMSQARSVTATFTLADTVPDAFTFGTKSGVTPGATVTSKPETITGINAPAPVTVANGLYAINCQEPYVSTPGTITNGQTMCVQHVAAPTALASRTTTLTIGGERGDFTSTTGGTAQTITFGQLLDRGVGSPPFGLFAFASSGLPVTFSSQTTGVCTVSGNTVTIVAAGSCTIAADQGGSAAILPAAQVVRSFAAATALDPGDIIAVTAGVGHSCALTTAGGVKCWGRNDGGQLGDGTQTGRFAPVEVSGLTSGVVAVAAGAYHTCALTTTGAVQCWGKNEFGQLGDDTTIVRLAPVGVSGLASGAVAVTAGGSHTCVLTTAGAVKCWGRNYEGQLGDGTLLDRSTPADVSGLTSGVVAVTAGDVHSCALMAGGGVKCWGSNFDGQLGDGTQTFRSMPVDVSGLTSGVVAFTAGREHTCALAAAGGVKCWGWNAFGQLGDGTQANHLTPVEVIGLASGVVAVTAGDAHTCALTMAGGVKCWGNNSYNQVGDGTQTDHSTPVDVAGLTSGVVAVAAGAFHTCALTTAGAVKCWGYNLGGQVGDGTQTNRSTPVDVVGLGGLDNAPHSFGWIGPYVVPISSVPVSSALTVGGYYDPAPIAVVGGEYSIGCSGSFTSAAGMINPGQSVCVRHVAASTYSTSVTTTLTIGGVSGTFTTTTASAPLLAIAPARLDFAARPVGTTSALQVVTVTNAGGHEITGLGWGANGDFAVMATTCTATLPPGASCTISVAFTPSIAGPRADDLLVFGANVNPATITARLTGTGLESDTTPGAFTFTDQFLVAPSTVITSAPVQVTGLTGAAPVSVANGSYCVSATNSCSSCTFRQDPSTITDGQYLCARHTSSPIPGGQVDTLVFVGGLGDAFTSITIDTVPAAFSFPPANGVAPSSTQVSAAAAIVGINAPAPVSVSGGTYSVGCTGAYTASPGTITNGQTVCVRHTAGSSAGATVSTTLDVGGVTATFASKVIEANPPLAVSPTELAFGGQSMNTTAPARIVTITNTGTGPLTVDAVTASTWFTVAHACTSLSAGASCPVSVRFTPAAEGALNGTLSIATSAGSQSVALTGTGERSFTTHYYQAILRRAPDAGGKAFWEAEAVRMRDLGASVNETWFAMASYFFTSPEYLALGRDDTGFATDLYTTFFNRAPDAGGLAFWTGQLAAGMPREVMLASFMFSPEFVGFTEALFGVNAVRKEVDMVVDFYRGLLARLPDTDGFTYWVGQFRQAQCQGAGAVTGRAETISSAFGLSSEYASRARTNEQYVGDLYNAFLRRGGDLGGVQYWIGEIAGGNRSREQVRQAFVASTEFQGRVAGVIAQGCVP